MPLRFVTGRQALIIASSQRQRFVLGAGVGGGELHGVAVQAQQVPELRVGFVVQVLEQAAADAGVGHPDVEALVGAAVGQP